LFVARVTIRQLGEAKTGCQQRFWYKTIHFACGKEEGKSSKKGGEGGISARVKGCQRGAISFENAGRTKSLHF